MSQKEFAQDLLSQKDLDDIAARGILPKQITDQFELLRNGIPAVRLNRPCTPGDGIVVLKADKYRLYRECFQSELQNNRFSQFVPASGAATRMFKFLITCHQQLVGNSRLDKDDAKKLECFFEQLPNFAFYEMLSDRLNCTDVREQQPLEILDALLGNDGLGFAGLPKGLIPFHRYADGLRTPFEEHLYEMKMLLGESDTTIKVHFTIPADHEAQIRKIVEDCRGRLSAEGSDSDVSFSFQKPATDTVAGDEQGRLFRDQNQKLLFRPGGHGALLENLNDLQGDIVFIKNIDNVAPDHLKPEIVRYKSLLAGYLIYLQKAIFDFLQKADEGRATLEDCRAMLQLMSEDMQLQVPETLPRNNLQACLDYLRSQLHRPLRICGMVPNEGEPGGGPFWVLNSDGTISKQIVESAQIDHHDPEQQRILAGSTHFNPVDLVCSLRDYRGRPFNLGDFRDPLQAFIARKDYRGRALTALELPGLWNGAMAFWNTVFVEVPAATFNPVKEVLDLLRPQHLPPQADKIAAAD